MFSWLLIAAWPLLAADAPATKAAKGIDFERARKHWSFRPLRTAPSGATIDGLMKPGPMFKVDARILARRAYLDAIGLPPTLEEAAAAAQRPWAETVDALLASPHFGERWGRHWLDCVRFAETDGHEFDVDKPNAFRYRDYVIRALNDDVPFNRFVLEHLAGDLLKDKRIVDGMDQSTIATGFYWLGEVINTPVDSVQSMADRVDNQIDVLGKAFLGLTTACARCHDHKFDPIPTADYYALAGIMHSSRPRQAAVAGLARTAPDRGICAGYDWQFSGAGFECVDGRVTSGKATFSATGSAVSNAFVIPKRYLHLRMAGAGELRLVVDEYRFPPGRQRGQPQEMKWTTVDLKMVEKRTAYFELADLETGAYLELDQLVFSDQKEPPDSLSTARVPAERGDAAAAPFALSTTEGDPLDVGIYIRGDHKNRGALRQRRFLTLFSGRAAAHCGG